MVLPEFSNVYGGSRKLSNGLVYKIACGVFFLANCVYGSRIITFESIIEKTGYKITKMEMIDICKDILIICNGVISNPTLWDYADSVNKLPKFLEAIMNCRYPGMDNVPEGESALDDVLINIDTSGISQDKNIPYSRVLSSISKEYTPKNKDIKYSKNNKSENIDVMMNPKISITLQEAEKQIEILNQLRKRNADYNTEFLYTLIYYYNLKGKYETDIKDISSKNSMYVELINKYKL
jgi:hypothetical protein